MITVYNFGQCVSSQKLNNEQDCGHHEEVSQTGFLKQPKCIFIHIFGKTKKNPTNKVSAN